MVAPTNINLDTLRGRAFQGFVQFQIPSATIPPTGTGTWYRLKERQNMTLRWQFNRVEHYSDDGSKFVDPAGSSHTFTMDIKLTSDMIDDVFSESSNKETLSYWIYRNTIHQPIQIIFVTTFGMTAGSAPPYDTEDTVNLKFILDPNSFTFGQGTNGGSPNVTVSGTVLSVTNALRATTGDQ